MSQADNDSDVRQLLTNPVSWVVGGIASIFGFFLSVGLDPIGAAVETVMVLVSSSTDLFTAFSILGFTVAPNIGGLPARELQALAVIFGAIAVAKLLDRVWERLKKTQ